MDRRAYMAEGYKTVPGWFARTDAILFDAIDRAQRVAGLKGDLLEIGCYQGCSAILLGYLRQSGERLVVCDLFEEPTLNAENAQERERFYVDLTRRSFEAHYLRFHCELPEIIQGPSSKLSEIGLRRTFRIVHVDGSHSYDVVRSDLLLAKQLLVPGGVVIFDDIVTLHTPGVTAAVWEGVLHDGLIPLVQSRKLYATWDPDCTIALPDELPRYPHDVLGRVMWHVEDPPVT